MQTHKKINKKTVPLQPFMTRKSDILLASIRNHKTLSNTEMFNLIIRLSIPSVLAQITSTLLFYIDAAMVGSLGAEASASIGIVETTTWLFGSLTSAAAMGFSVQVAHRIGGNDFVGARSVFRQALVITISFASFVAIAGILISPFLPFWLGAGEDIATMASTYFLIFALTLPFYQVHNLSCSMLKCAGNMRIPSMMSILMCIMDATFNYLFIFIFNLGVKGAAMGTALAILFSCCITGWFAIVKSSQLGLFHEKGRWMPTSDVVLKALRISVPMGTQYVLMNVAQVLSTIIVAPLGNISIAANSLAITAESLCYMPGYGVGEAATTLVGQSLGASEYKLCRGFAYRAVTLGMLVMALMGLIMYILAPEMIGIMTPVDEIRILGTKVLRIEAWAEPMFAASIVCIAVFVGAGDTLRPACISLATMWGVRLTLAALLASEYGLPGVWFAMAVELSVRGTLMIARLLNGNWIKVKLNDK